MDSDPDKWFWDRISRNLVQMHSIEEMLYSGKTEFQAIEIIRSGSYGRFLVLDGKIQSSDADEFVYHEALVQPPMVTHPSPETVFIAGGGEGATLREVLAHNTVKRAVMVDIDPGVVDVCRRHLPEYSRGAFDDPRVELRHEDARDYLAKSAEPFDVIIIDLPEPIEQGPAYLLYTREFYEIIREKLSGDGIISVQSGSASWTELTNLAAVNHTLKSVFPVVCVYQADIPSFGGPWGFCQASTKLNPLELSEEEVDRRIAARRLPQTKFYDGLTHRAIFSLPKHLRGALGETGRLITDADPLYMYAPK